jgi:hypothetical protein
MHSEMVRRTGSAARPMNGVATNDDSAADSLESRTDRNRELSRCSPTVSEDVPAYPGYDSFEASLTFVHVLPREYLICRATLDRWVCILSHNGTHVPLRQSMFPVS